MRVNSINTVYPKHQLKQNNQVGKVKADLPEQKADSVSFKGAKNATKGALILGAIGAVVGAVCSGGIAIPATMAYFGACNAAIGAMAGSQVDDDVI